MPEVADEEKAEGLDIERYRDIVRRRYPHFLVSLFVGWLVVWTASWFLPVSYRSGTLILVEESTMPRDYVTPNINDDLQGRLQNLTQQIISRTRLLRIIDDLNLYSGDRRKMTPDEKVERMRKDINIELVRDAREQITAFNISYSARDPHIAQQVTGDLTQLFIHENLEVRQQQSEGTTKFLEGQLENARKNLAEQEAKVREFEGSHEGNLPSQQATSLQILSGLQSQLDKAQEALNTAQQQRVYLQTLISQYRTFQTTSKPADITATGLPAIDKELDRLKTQLATLSSQYTDQYPGIRSLKLQIAKTEKMREEVIAGLKSRDSGGSGPEGSTGGHEMADPSQGATLLQLQGQLQANQVEIADREQTIAGLKSKVNEYQARLNQEPETEQKLADLTRGYDQSKANYDDLLKKESGSRMATSMEEMQQGERFRMIDPPSLPLKPDFPNHLKFCEMAVGVGFALGIFVAGGLEFLDDRLQSDKQIKALLPMRVIAEIPEVVSAVDLQRNKNRMLIWCFVAAFVFVTILVGSAISYRLG